MKKILVSRKKLIIIAAVGLAVCLCIAGLVFGLTRSSGGNSDEVVYVNSIGDIIGYADAGVQNRYAGIVEAQEEWNIQKDDEKVIKEIFVEVGQEVAEGTELFAYDLQEAKDKLSQAELEIQQIDNTISDKKSEQKSLEKQKKETSGDERRKIENEIEIKKTEVRQEEYKKESKNLEIEQLKDSLENNAVKSKIGGVVKEINSEGSYDMYGETTAFMTILSSDEYRIKGKVNEQNVGWLEEGSPVIIRSRVAAEEVWTGTLAEIEIDIYGGAEGEGEGGENEMVGSSTYPFYVTLDSADGLMLGQHVSIEMDLGQGESREGLWLDDMYLFEDGGDMYVWAASAKDKIEKRKVELGEYDDELMQYEILGGLTTDDYIAFPEEHIKAGMKIQKEEEFPAGDYIDDGTGEYEEEPEQEVGDM